MEKSAVINSDEISSILENVKSSPSERYESETIEFKEYRDKGALFNSSQEVATELSALANLFGGSLIVGVKDSNNVRGENWSSQLVGFERVDEFEVARRIEGNLRPAVDLNVQNFLFEGKNYLIISIEKDDGTLVMTAGGKCYIRSGRDSIPMTPDVVARKIKSLSTYDWSSDVLESVNIDEALDEDTLEEAINEFCSLRGLGSPKPPKDYFLESIGVTVNGKLTKGGLLFLGNASIISDVIGSIEYRFSKIEGSDIPLNEVWTGSIWGAIAKIRLLFEQVSTYSEFVHDDKVYTFPNISQESFYEAMSNSLVHRDYTHDGQISIEFTNDEVSFVNPGGFYGGVTPENILLHQPRHRNKALATILMNFRLMDRAGMGTKRMSINALRLGRTSPRFSTAHDCVSVSLDLNTVKEGIWILASSYKDYGVVELLLLNFLYGRGCIKIYSIIEEMKGLVADPWKELYRAIERVGFLTLIGNKEGIYVAVKDSFRDILKAYERIRIYASSASYVAIFIYLQNKGDATCNELFEALTLDSLSQTQRLLREAEFISKKGSGVNTEWYLS